MTEKTLKKARGLNSIADPAAFRGSKGRKSSPSPSEVVPINRQDRSSPLPANDEKKSTPASSEPFQKKTSTSQLEHSKNSREKRIRRELSIPIPIAEALERTGINAADVTMAAYRKHSDAIYDGEMGRRVFRGRVRLRLTLSEKEFDKVVRLGQARGWNKSETVSVLLAAELLD